MKKINEFVNERLTLNNQTKIQKSPNNNVIEFCKFLSELFKEDSEMIDLGEVEAMLGEDPLGIDIYIKYNDPWKEKEFNDFTLREKMLLCEFCQQFIIKKDYDKSLKTAINFFNSDSYYEDWKQNFNYDED